MVEVGDDIVMFVSDCGGFGLLVYLWNRSDCDGDVVYDLWFWWFFVGVVWYVLFCFGFVCVGIVFGWVVSVDFGDVG